LGREANGSSEIINSVGPKGKRGILTYTCAVFARSGFQGGVCLVSSLPLPLLLGLAGSLLVVTIYFVWVRRLPRK
jgi:hypothetical protein